MSDKYHPHGKSSKVVDLLTLIKILLHFMFARTFSSFSKVHQTVDTKHGSTCTMLDITM